MVQAHVRFSHGVVGLVASFSIGLNINIVRDEGTDRSNPCILVGSIFEELIGPHFFRILTSFVRNYLFIYLFKISIEATFYSRLQFRFTRQIQLDPIN